MKRELTAKQKKFCHEYLKDLNATNAYKRAGYKGKGAEVSSCKLLKNPKVEAYLATHREKIQEKSAITIQKVLEELGAIGFCNVEDLFEIHDDRITLIAEGERPARVRKAIKKIKFTRRVDGRGEDADEIETVEIELHDKQKALELIGKHLGMFSQKIEAEITDGTQKAKFKAMFDSMTPEEKILWLKENANG
jgi:phage terminase small subunit